MAWVSKTDEGSDSASKEKQFDARSAGGDKSQPEREGDKVVSKEIRARVNSNVAAMQGLSWADKHKK